MTKGTHLRNINKFGKKEVFENTENNKAENLDSDRTKLKATTLVPKSLNKKTLVLDLDETLIHSSFEAMPNCSFSLKIKQEGGDKTIYINKRPFLEEFLEITSRLFDIVIFTAGTANYANSVINEIDKNKILKTRFFRDSCIFWRGLYIKNLEILKKPLKDVIIVDNSPICYCLHPDNAIPIESFYDDKSDLKLLQLLPLLRKLAIVDDVTPVLKSLFNNSGIYKEDKCDEQLSERSWEEDCRTAVREIRQSSSS